MQRAEAPRPTAHFDAVRPGDKGPRLPDLRVESFRTFVFAIIFTLFASDKDKGKDKGKDYGKDKGRIKIMNPFRTGSN